MQEYGIVTALELQRANDAVVTHELLQNVAHGRYADSDFPNLQNVVAFETILMFAVFTNVLTHAHC